MTSKSRVLLFVVFGIGSLLLTGCPGNDNQTADQNGLRVYAFESTTVLSGNDFPVDGVIDGGESTGSGGIGGAFSFAGVTANGGYDDHYNINLGTTWEITYNWTPVIPECGQDILNDVYLDPSGDFVSETCELW